MRGLAEDLHEMAVGVAEIHAPAAVFAVVDLARFLAGGVGEVCDPGVLDA
jgi:hypothetical protein